MPFGGSSPNDGHDGDPDPVPTGPSKFSLDSEAERSQGLAPSERVDGMASTGIISLDGEDDGAIVHAMSTRSAATDDGVDATSNAHSGQWGGLSHMLADIWRPVPQGVMRVVRGIKDLKQSVVEVIKITEVKAKMPPDMLQDDYYAVVEVERYDIETKHCKFCRRKTKPFLSFAVDLLCIPGGGELIGAKSIAHCECQTLRITRRRGLLRVRLRIVSKKVGRRKSQSEKSSTIAHYVGTVPFSGLRENHIELKPVGKKGISLGAWVIVQLVDATEVFHLERCRPVKWLGGGYNEWRPDSPKAWQEVWYRDIPQSVLSHASDLVRAMEEEMKLDVILVYHTLFAQNQYNSPPRPKLSEDEERLHDTRILFMKRLVLCFAVCKVMFCTEANATVTRSWPYPLASILCHGSRVLIRLDGVPAKEFLNFLLFGDTAEHDWAKDGVPQPLWARWAATHDIGLHHQTSQLFERRLGKRDLKKNLAAGHKHQHLGLDLPVGGLGSPCPNSKHDKDGKLLVGPSGVPWKSKKGKKKKASEEDSEETVYAKDLQHGHMYIRYEDFGPTSVPVLKHQKSLHVVFAVGDKVTASRSDGVKYPAIIVETLSEGHLFIVEWEDGHPADLVKQASQLSNSEIQLEVTGATHSFGKSFAKAKSQECKDDDDEDDDLDVEEGPSPTSVAVASKPTVNFGGDKDQTWMVMPYIRTTADLKTVLEDHKHKELANDDDAVAHLYRHISDQKELAMESTDEMDLRCRGVIVHLVLEREDPLGGEEEVLVHRSATAEGCREDECAPEGAEPETLTVEDLRVPMVVRRRHEPWTEAVTRYCHSEFGLSAEAVDLIVERCRSAEEEMSIYPCEPPPTLCWHLSKGTSGIPVQYQACHFKFVMLEKDRELFAPILKEDLTTTEHDVELEGFDGHEPARGPIARKWRWEPKSQASRTKVQGLHPPEGRLQITREAGSLSALLLGIEGSAPLKENCFCVKHGMGAKSKDISVFGKRKWRFYRQGGREVPADIGGLHMIVDKAGFDSFKEVVNAIPMSVPSDSTDGYMQTDKQSAERDLFRNLLQSADSEVDLILKSSLSYRRPSMVSHANTVVLDNYVRDRSAHSTNTGLKLGLKLNTKSKTLSLHAMKAGGGGRASPLGAFVNTAQAGVGGVKNVGLLGVNAAGAGLGAGVGAMKAGGRFLGLAKDCGRPEGEGSPSASPSASPSTHPSASAEGWQARTPASDDGGDGDAESGQATQPAQPAPAQAASAESRSSGGDVPNERSRVSDGTSAPGGSDGASVEVGDVGSGVAGGGGSGGEADGGPQEVAERRRVARV